MDVAALLISCACLAAIIVHWMAVGFWSSLQGAVNAGHKDRLDNQKDRILASEKRLEMLEETLQMKPNYYVSGVVDDLERRVREVEEAVEGFTKGFEKALGIDEESNT